MTAHDHPPHPTMSALMHAATATAFDALTAQAAVLDERGVIVHANPAWTAFMAAHQHPCDVGVNLMEVSARGDGPCGADGARLAAALQTLLRGDHPAVDLEYPCTDDRWLALHARTFHVQNEAYVLVVQEDATSQHLADARQQAIDEEVRRAVRDRTSDLREENSDLNAFIGAVSHDLKTPVRHIHGFLGQLRRRLGEVGAEEARLLGILDHATNRLDGMIDELLALARVASTPLHFTPVNLNDTVHAARAAVHVDAEGRDVHWEIGPLPVIHGDPHLLELAFTNLLSNALKYTARRPRTHIRVAAERQGDELHVSVRDNGVGFPPEQATRLFGAFQRLHAERDFPGIGMGLANVKRIVERHEGRVWADSEPGAGATFTVAFPAPPEGPA
ncbi:sensor histidine kinase [Deinococcus maricopensis]|uniref:histidine kinase n=1 Tax=Deinococcus maricopensis (strain DSM 21211 / LMG 22137 / NRRL B-23946 / LB-34) TaxID=709986 RepID=E8UBT9_DEIML|nr:ATP-binding protein [Deinococcus maricopensis]ADV68528.1 PAS/PAC sensor signal transduction histidine kinase [Deinococcus maricopensis DSM 21211]